MKATWKNTILAESNDTVVVENNHYFPADSVNMDYLKKNDDTYECSWKGTCYYFDVEVDGEKLNGAAFSYPEPKDAAKNITGRFAFWKDVKVGE